MAHFSFPAEIATSLGDLGKQLEAITERMKEEDSRADDEMVRLCN